jgi:hypothetical protein
MTSKSRFIYRLNKNIPDFKAMNTLEGGKILMVICHLGTGVYCVHQYHFVGNGFEVRESSTV